MAKLSNELQAEVAKFKIDKSGKEQQNAYEPAKVEHKPVHEQKTTEHKIPDNKTSEHKIVKPGFGNKTPENKTSENKISEHGTSEH
ncbi:MAG: hypothetical protein QSU88_01760, partial [Candidatus Methanoperedens sp.]|nr:hypothetical protein [Candidatus Methanoperedens sp.]